MVCTRDVSYQNSYGSQPVTTILHRCVKNKGYLPSFTPVISNLSITTSVTGVYSLVYINGSNFNPPCNGVTFVNFGSFKNLPVTFYSSFDISFVVPLNAPTGNYDVVVCSVYNNNFSPGVNQNYTGNTNYSNSVIYTIT
jgi:hypothetical protein